MGRAPAPHPSRPQGGFPRETPSPHPGGPKPRPRPRPCLIIYLAGVKEVWAGRWHSAGSDLQGDF